MDFINVDGKMYGRKRDTGKWVEINPPANWSETEVSQEKGAELERIFQNYDEYCEKLREEKYGPRPKSWDYLSYLDEMERIEGGKPLLAGNIEPNDALHETGAATLG